MKAPKKTEYLRGFGMAAKLAQALRCNGPWDWQGYLEVVAAICRDVGKDDLLAQGLAAGAEAALGRAA